jgi:hypothetical protein
MDESQLMDESFLVQTKLADGIIPVDGQILVDGCEFRVTVMLSRWLCKNHDS